MELYKFLFITMTVRFARAFRDPATRLWFAPLGPLAVVGGIAALFIADAGGARAPLTFASYVSGSPK